VKGIVLLHTCEQAAFFLVESNITGDGEGAGAELESLIANEPLVVGRRATRFLLSPVWAGAESTDMLIS
jgi:hypothetical protein